MRLQEGAKRDPHGRGGRHGRLARGEAQLARPRGSLRGFAHRAVLPKDGLRLSLPIGVEKWQQ